LDRTRSIASNLNRSVGTATTTGTIAIGTIIIGTTTTGITGTITTGATTTGIIITGIIATIGITATGNPILSCHALGLFSSI
jgi:hypothetical protein